MSNRLFAVIGAPGCGKGTLIKSLFGENSHVVPMSGMLINLRTHRDLGPIVTETMDSGALVPSEIVNKLFLKHWNEIYSEKKDIILDGVVRTEIQAEFVASLVSNEKNPGCVPREFHILHIDVPLKECQRRMIGRGRSDDSSQEIINRRFVYWEAFHRNTIACLRHHGFHYIGVDGNQTPEDVHKEAVEKIASFNSLSLK